jgi:hypothetical protein
MHRATLMALVACASGRQGRQPEKPVDELAAVTEVCQILTRDPLSPVAAREALGRSASPAVRAARVIDAVGGAAPNVVELELPRAVPLAAFDQAFGAGEPSVQLHLGDPLEWAYSSKALAQQHVTCAIFARVADDGVRFVTVRRDRHQ